MLLKDIWGRFYHYATTIGGQRRSDGVDPQSLKSRWRAQKPDIAGTRKVNEAKSDRDAPSDMIIRILSS